MKALIGGSPCTHWSIAQTKNRETEASGVGWELFLNYRIARDKYQPDYFLYENNKSMSPAIRAQITAELGVEPVLINSALVSAQNRQRLYWVGKREPDGTYSQVKVEQPEDRGILLQDILETGFPLREKSYARQTVHSATAYDAVARRQRNTVAEPVAIKPLTEREMDYMVGEHGKYSDRWTYLQKPGEADKALCITANVHRGVPYNICAEPVRIGTVENDAKKQDFDSQQYRVYSPDAKSVTLCGNGGGLGAKTGLYAVPIKEKKVGIYPNGNGELTQCQSKRIYSVDAKGRVLNAGPGGLGVQTGLYAVPVAGRVVGRRINEQGHRDDYNEAIPHFQYFEVNEEPQKTNCLTTVQKDNMIAVPVVPNGKGQFVIKAVGGKEIPVYDVRGGRITIKGKTYPIKLADGFYIIRKLTVTECKRLQTVPDTYAFPVSDTQAYKMLGNGWTVDVIARIMSHFTGLTEEPVEVLSMYDGMSCGHIALDKLGANVAAYYATEIDKYAIQTTQHNFPDTVQLGDAVQVREEDWVL